LQKDIALNFVHFFLDHSVNLTTDNGRTVVQPDNMMPSACLKDTAYDPWEIHVGAVYIAIATIDRRNSGGRVQNVTRCASAHTCPRRTYCLCWVVMAVYWQHRQRTPHSL